MIIKKYIETYVDIADPNDMYAANRDEMLIQKLTDKFVGVCYNSCYILNINKLIRRSYLYMKDTLEGDSQLSVLFEVDALIYAKGEVINGCTIVKKEPNGIVHAKSQYAGIQINITRNLDIFKEGDVVPIIVKRVRYNINQPEVTVLATPFIPPNDNVVYYKPTGKLDDNQSKDIDKILKQIGDAKKMLSSQTSTNKKIIKFFINLIALKKQKQPKILQKISIHDVKKWSVINEGALVLEQGDNPHVLQVQIGDSSMSKLVSSSVGNSAEEKSESFPSVDESLIVEETIYNICTIFLLNHLQYLQTIQGFLKQYPTFAAVQKNKSIWKLYNMLKK